MTIWDRGTYEEHKFRDDEVMVTFHGERVRGRYVLFRTARRRLDDPPDGPAGGPGPRADARASSSRCSRATGRAAARRRPLGVRDQVGRRARDRVRAGRPADRCRRAAAATSRARYPELRPIAEALAGREVVLDGEVVAFDGARPSFQKLQGRMHLTVRARGAAARARRPGPLHRLRPALPRRPLAAATCPTTSAARALAELELQRADVAGAGAPRRRRRRAARADARAAARGRRSPSGSTARTCPGRRTLGLGEGQERQHDRRRDRRLAAGRGRPLRAGSARS